MPASLDPPRGHLSAVSLVGSAGTLHLPLSLPRDSVLPFLDYPPGRQPPPRTERLLLQALVEARELAVGRGTWRRLPAEMAAEVGLPVRRGHHLLLGLVTAGSGIERRVKEHLAAGALTRALLLDAVGSAAAEEAADRLSALLLGHGVAEPMSFGCRVSPGYGTWPLQAQRAVFEVLPHAEVGVALNPSMLMIPRKSVSFALWLMPDGQPLPMRRGCAVCGLTTCRYRRQPQEDPSSPSTPPERSTS